MHLRESTVGRIRQLCLSYYSIFVVILGIAPKMTKILPQCYGLPRGRKIFVYHEGDFGEQRSRTR